ncbi:hypothetical protein HDU86_002389 [Geranomyces michiganensis]|nr:hypothetical protein HDU86_002389 [Geranomyces michiganensis]
MSSSPPLRRTSSRLAKSAARETTSTKPVSDAPVRSVKRRKVETMTVEGPMTTVSAGVVEEVALETSEVSKRKRVAVRKKTTTVKAVKKTSVSHTADDEENVDDEGSCCSSYDEKHAADANKKAAKRSKKKGKTAGDVDTEELKEPKPKKKAAPKKKGGPLTEMSTDDMWARANETKKYIGAHISAAGGVWNAIENSVDIGGTAMALFVRNQRKWTSPPTPASDIAQFAVSAALSKHDPRAHILPHGSYLINLANPDAEKNAQALEAFTDELSRCEALGISLYNFHPGSTLKEPRDEAIARIAKAINKAHEATEFVTIVLENMAGQGNVIGSDFADLREIIAGVTNKERIGVCLDTCHTFAAGYDLRTKTAYEATMQEFESIVGFKYLRGIHLNDSKADLGENKDRHENIGKGKIGWEGFRLLMNDERLNNIPMVLETPTGDLGDNGHSVYKKEITQLYELVGKEEGYIPS